MPSNWSKIRDEWLDRTAVAKNDAKWALEALIDSEEDIFDNSIFLNFSYLFI